MTKSNARAIRNMLIGIAIALMIALALRSNDPHTIRFIDSPTTTTTTAPPAPPCQEDEPCWDCHTMGNLICGEGVEHEYGATFWYDGGAEDSGIEVYPDGAGVQYSGGDEVRTFPAGTFYYPAG